MKKLVLAVAVSVFSTGSFATCSNADLSGTWSFYTNLAAAYAPTAVICTLKIPAKGTILQNSTCSYNGALPEPQQVTLSVDKNCHVTGILGSSTTLDGYISKGKDSLGGFVVYDGDSTLFVANKL